MRRLTLMIWLLVMSTAAQAERPLNATQDSCEVLAIFLDHPEVMWADMHTFLDGMTVAVEATGLPRGSFDLDYRRICDADQNLTIAQAIGLTFELYTERLGGN
jgi:hypothetical protein